MEKSKNRKKKNNERLYPNFFYLLLRLKLLNPSMEF